MVVEAWSEPDGIVEAIRWRGPSYVFGVQWHPEFMRPGDRRRSLDGTPILDEFLDAARARKAQALARRWRRRRMSRSPIPPPARSSRDVAADGPRDGRGASYAAARAAQPRWAATADAQAHRTRSRSFASCVVATHETLAHTLTQEVGKPIRQSRNELNGLLGAHRLLPRRDRRARCASEKVLRRRGAEARGAHHARAARRRRQHLGVELSVLRRQQRVRAGARRRQRGAVQAVGIRDADRAGTSRDLLHAAGVPEDVFVPVIGGGATGAALLRQPVDGVFFTGSYATGAKIAASAGKRMIKVQLELGGKDPVYVCDDVDVKAAAAGRRRRRVLQHRPVVLLGRAHLRARVDLRRVRRRVRRRGEGATGSAIRWTNRPTSARSRAGRSSTCCERQVADAQTQGRDAC